MRPLALALCLAAIGCGSSSDDLGAGSSAVAPGCELRATRSCACPGATGAQTCEAADGGGAEWGACVCPGESDGGADGGDAGAAVCDSPETCGCASLGNDGVCPSNAPFHWINCTNNTLAGCADWRPFEKCCY